MREAGNHIPALDGEPEIDGFLYQYFTAFKILSRGRTLSMGGISGIRITDMVAYAKAFHFLDVQRFIRYLSALDAEFMLIMAEKADKA